MAAIFESLIGTTLTGGILTLIAFAVLPATKRLLPAKWNGRLLSAILVFFLVPIGTAASALFERISALFVRESDFAAFWDDIPAPLDMPMMTGAPVNPANATLLETVLPALPVVWIIGMLVTLIVKFSQLIRFENLLAKSNEQITDAKMLYAFWRIKKELGIADSVTMWRNSGISTPMLMGLLRTRLLIPQIDLNSEELELVLRHELTHHRNHDLWIKFIAMLTSAIHWFNPCIYLLSSGLEHFLELACDADVVSEMDREQRRVYGTTILTVLGRASFRQPQVYAAFSSNKKAMKGRLSAMLNGKKQSKKIMLFSILVLVFICVIGIGVSAAAKKEIDKINPIITNKHEGYSLVGDGYIVRVTKKQFDEFGTGEFADGDLEKFIKAHDLVKQYPENGEPDAPPALTYTERERESVTYTPREAGASDEPSVPQYAEIEQADADDSVAYYTPADSEEASQDMGHSEANGQPNPLDFAEGTAPKFSSFLWPTDGGYISTSVNGYPGHTGMDVKVDLNTPVYASAPGIVVRALDMNVAYGKYVVIDHGGGYQTLYAHNNSLADLSAGDMVEAGQVIAYAGRSGNATGVHVHFEIRKNGRIMDPEDYVNIDNTPMEWPQE